MAFLQHLRNIRANAIERDTKALDTAVGAAVSAALDLGALRGELVRGAAKPDSEVRVLIEAKMRNFRSQHGEALRLLAPTPSKAETHLSTLMLDRESTALGALPSVRGVLKRLRTEFDGVTCSCLAHVDADGHASIRFLLEAPDVQVAQA